MIRCKRSRRQRSNARLNHALFDTGDSVLPTIRVHRLEWAVEIQLAAERKRPLQSQDLGHRRHHRTTAVATDRSTRLVGRLAEGGRLHGPGSRCAEPR